jgi:hypothetical protein
LRVFFAGFAASRETQTGESHRKSNCPVSLTEALRARRGMRAGGYGGLALGLVEPRELRVSVRNGSCSRELFLSPSTKGVHRGRRGTRGGVGVLPGSRGWRGSGLGNRCGCMRDADGKGCFTEAREGCEAMGFRSRDFALLGVLLLKRPLDRRAELHEALG